MAQATAISSSALIKNAGGRCWGYVIGSATTGTVKLWDNTSAAGRVLLETTTALSTSFNGTFSVPVDFQTGLYCTIGGTATVTIIWE